ALRRRVVVERIQPAVDGGRFPIKRTLGESVTVTADIFSDGHEVVAAVLRYRTVQGSGFRVQGSGSGFNLPSSQPPTPHRQTEPRTLNAEPGTDRWQETPLSIVAPGTDEWTATFAVTRLGWHEYSLVAWVDKFRTWRRDLIARSEAGQDVWLELLEGSMLVRE